LLVFKRGHVKIKNANHPRRAAWRLRGGFVAEGAGRAGRSPFPASEPHGQIFDTTSSYIAFFRVLTRTLAPFDFLRWIGTGSVT
jgi:hypothetical protein